ncbi:L,D-transpeptidase family protein [Citrobacter portucalensis]|uniref:L,D-transpeptidase family protein n=1 Tax=Citrobacter portucalensis TaxID=1639133 RepID=UPI0018E840D3|nr:L,D-transpeptidase family protein [Citrobacter portucalensis]UMB89132.1 L,D-transpeptidase family protein [Citrobacter portucalensis]
MNTYKLFTALILAFNIPSAFAVTYPLPTNGGLLVGRTQYEQIPQGNKAPLETYAAKYHIGMSNMMDANPGVDVYLPDAGTVLTFPLQTILPNTLHQGIIINTAEMRLYYYPKGTNNVEIYPVGIGQIGHDTPEHWVTSVLRKKVGPTWTPTKDERAEFAAEGDNLPAVVPAGSANPMGLFAMYVGNEFAIHGTNANFGIGLRVSHGCVRLRADDLKTLFSEVPVGTRVEFVNQPIKVSVAADGARYVEVHSRLSESDTDGVSNQSTAAVIPASLRTSLTASGVQQDVLKQALTMRSGMPVRLN